MVFFKGVLFYVTLYTLCNTQLVTHCVTKTYLLMMVMVIIIVIKSDSMILGTFYDSVIPFTNPCAHQRKERKTLQNRPHGV